MSKNRILFAFFCLSILITVIWFRSGLLFATAEEGMPFYSPGRSAELFKNAWIEDGTGYTSPIFKSQYPLLFILKYMNFLIPAVPLQATIFCFLIASGLVGMFLLVDNITQDRKLSLFSALLFFFNLYTMSQIWSRALFAAMFMWAYLPIFLFFWLKTLKEKKKIWLVLFLLTSFIYSYSYSYIASLLVFWVTAGLYVLYSTVYVQKNNVERLRIIAKSVVILAVWAICNLWWLYPFLKLANSSYGTISTASLSFESLKAVSGFFPISEIIQLKQKFYFNFESNNELPWDTFYESGFTKFITWLGFALVFWGWIKSRKNKYWKYLTLMLLVGLFISKGTNPPFGFLFYKVLFERFPFLIVLRNSYEKFGLVFLLPYSVFFAYGIMEIASKFSRPFKKLLFLGIMSFAFFVYLVLPIWNGKVFWDYYFVSVPKYYSQLNEYLKKDTTNGRVLVLPMLPFHGVRFLWGYRGDEPSRYLLDKNVISHNPNIGYYSMIYTGLTKAFLSDSPIVESLLAEANIKYILVNHDVDWRAVGSVSPEQAKKTLEGRKSIRAIKNFGNLEVYQFQNASGYSSFEALGANIPDIIEKKLNPAHYIIQIKGAKESFQLVFKQTFDSLWEAKIGDQKIEKHHLIYGYANAWNIDKNGDFEIEIMYKVWPWD